MLLNEAKTLKESIQDAEKVFGDVESQFFALFKKIPNIPTPDTPVGLTEDENVVVKQWGAIPEFGFPVRNHAQIAEIR